MNDNERVIIISKKFLDYMIFSLVSLTFLIFNVFKIIAFNEKLYNNLFSFRQYSQYLSWFFKWKSAIWIKNMDFPCSSNSEIYYLSGISTFYDFLWMPRRSDIQLLSRKHFTFLRASFASQICKDMMLLS